MFSPSEAGEKEREGIRSAEPDFSIQRPGADPSYQDAGENASFPRAASSAG